MARIPLKDQLAALLTMSSAQLHEHWVRTTSRALPQVSSVYEPDPAGQTLVDWLKTDWDLFNHPAMDVAHANELLGEILDDGDIV